MCEIARDSWSAWVALREHGGIEVDGRDRDFVLALQEDLAPDARNLEEAVGSVSTDRLVRAIFRRVSPFSKMFADINSYFKAAGARTGRAHWRILIEDQILELKEFEDYLSTWSSIAGLVSVPALDFAGIWELLRLLRTHPHGDPLGFARRHSDDPEIDAWYRAYESGDLPPIPAILDPARIGEELSEPAAVVAVVAQVLRDHASNRAQMMDAYYARGGDGSKGDAFEIGTVLQNEMDYLLGSMVGVLDRWRAFPSPGHGLGQSISVLFARYGRVEFPLDVTISDLERVLSLPIWRTRHELYAVWVATQVVASLPNHDIEIHHEGGKIVFAFKETVLATIRNIEPVIRLIGERRSHLETPMGKGRVRGVQPDLGLWVESPTGEHCLLVIEVKHYRRAARRRFHEVLADYAAGHPKAKIMLVNYGPVAEMLNGLDSETQARCQQLGDLTPTNADQLALFRKHVQEVIAEATAVGSLAPRTNDAVALIIDVSSSMRPLLLDDVFEEFISTHGKDFDLAALVDTEVQALARIEGVVARAREYEGGSTELVESLRLLARGRVAVVVVTDSEGADQLQRVDDEFVVSRNPWGDLGMFVVVAQQSKRDSPSTRERSVLVQGALEDGAPGIIPPWSRKGSLRPR